MATRTMKVKMTRAVSPPSAMIMPFERETRQRVCTKLPPWPPCIDPHASAGGRALDITFQCHMLIGSLDGGRSRRYSDFCRNLTQMWCDGGVL